LYWQDQMVLAMLRLMDSLLQQQGLDLALTPYRVLATGVAEGLVERVHDCLPLADILKEKKGDIRRYLAQYHPDAAAPYGIEPQVRRAGRTTSTPHLCRRTPNPWTHTRATHDGFVFPGLPPYGIKPQVGPQWRSVSTLVPPDPDPSDQHPHHPSVLFLPPSLYARPCWSS
jgi:hypothetical protein